MIITAKFASVCPCCSIRIVAGSKVEWSKGSPARHVACAGSATASNVVTVSRPSRPDARRAYRTPFTRCEGWGSDNPHAPRQGHCFDCAAMG